VQDARPGEGLNTHPVFCFAIEESYRAASSRAAALFAAALARGPIALAGRGVDKSRAGPPLTRRRRLPKCPTAAFGIDLDGDVGPEAAGLIGDWCRSLAAGRAANGCPAEDARTEVVVGVARAFSSAVVAQLLAR
jgi:hypothetical protein